MTPVSVETKGHFYTNYHRLNESYSKATFECAENTVRDLMTYRTDNDKPGMLLGKVQSGKTRTFMTIMSLAFDNQFDIIFLLTKNSIALVSQTIARVQKEFSFFVSDNLVEVYDIMRAPVKYSAYELNVTKQIFVAKKQKDNIRKLQDLIKNHSELQNKNILIIDDEADSASVGYSGAQDRVVATIIANLISQVRQLSKRISLLQVTATPYALYLQPQEIEVVNNSDFRPLRPAFTHLVPVPDDYVGGDTYFGEASRPQEPDKPTIQSMIHVEVDPAEFEVLKKADRRKINDRNILTAESIKTYRSALVNFFVGGSLLRLIKVREGVHPARLRYSFLLHTEQTQAAHRWQRDLTHLLLESFTIEISSQTTIFREMVSTSYDDLAISLGLVREDIPSLDEVYADCVKALTQGEFNINIVNSENDVAALLDNSGQLRLAVPFTIFIGGQAIDRGVTVSGMIGFYYGRRPRTMQQDTVLQHSRMYGYRRPELPVTRFYTSAQLRSAMSKMEEFDAFLRESVQTGGDQSIQFIRKSDDGRIIPCSPNKVRVSRTETVRGFKRYLPIGFQTLKGQSLNVRRAFDKITDEIHRVGAFEPSTPVLIDIESCENLIRAIQAVLEFPDGPPEFDWDSMLTVMRHLSYQSTIESRRGKVLLWAAKDRNVSRKASAGSHAVYIETPDSDKTEGDVAREHAQSTPILFLLGQRGNFTSGWRGDPFYWPVLRAQKDARTAIYAPELVNDSDSEVDDDTLEPVDKN